MSTPEQQISTAIKQAIAENDVLLFMKGTPEAPRCGFSARTVAALETLGAPFAAVDVLPDPRIRQELSALSNWPTIPQLFVRGELVGGCDIVTEMYETGELAEVIGVEAPGRRARSGARGGGARGPAAHDREQPSGTRFMTQPARRRSAPRELPGRDRAGDLAIERGDPVDLVLDGEPRPRSATRARSAPTSAAASAAARSSTPVERDSRRASARSIRRSARWRSVITGRPHARYS